MNRVGWALIVAAVGCATALHAQQTVEEIFLRNVEFQILREQAFSTEDDLKIETLSQLDEMIQAGLSENDQEQVGFILEYLALEGSAVSIRAEGRQLNNHPGVRRRAARLLGQVGSEAAGDALVTVLLRDVDPAVRAESAFSLGAVGSDAAVPAIAFSVSLMDPSSPDNGLAMASVVALERIANQNNGLTDPAAYEALVTIAGGGAYYRSVRNKALQVLSDLRKFQS